MGAALGGDKEETCARSFACCATSGKFVPREATNAVEDHPGIVPLSVFGQADKGGPEELPEADLGAEELPQALETHQLVEATLAQAEREDPGELVQTSGKTLTLTAENPQLDNHRSTHRSTASDPSDGSPRRGNSSNSAVTLGRFSTAGSASTARERLQQLELLPPDGCGENSVTPRHASEGSGARSSPGSVLHTPHTSDTRRSGAGSAIGERPTMSSSATALMNMSIANEDIVRYTPAHIPLARYGLILRQRGGLDKGAKRHSRRASTQQGEGTSSLNSVASISSFLRGVYSSKSNKEEEETKWEKDGLYMYSRRTDVIDEFWSHSWRASSFFKIMALLIYYNGRPAVVISSVISTFMSVMYFFAYLPHSRRKMDMYDDTFNVEYGHACWGTLSGLVAFVFVFLLWRPSTRVFLDKVCIHQIDERLKKQGIESIAGFLKCSVGMLVLWDAHYSERLWCVCELAGYSKLNQGTSHSKFKIWPIYLGPMITATILFSSTFWMVFLTLKTGYEEEGIIWALAYIFPCLWALVHCVRLYDRKVQKLWKQLRTFSAAASVCYCCSVNHVDPDDGHEIMCDRLAVYQSIDEWFGNLEAFDSYVHNTVAGVFRRQLGSLGLPFRWTLVAGMPCLWAGIDLAMARQRDVLVRTQWWCCLIDCLIIWVLIFPTFLACIFLVSRCFRRCSAKGPRGLLVTTWTSLLVLFLFSCFYFTWKFAVRKDPVVGRLVFAPSCAIITAGLYNSRVKLIMDERRTDDGRTSTTSSTSAASMISSN